MEPDEVGVDFEIIGIDDEVVIPKVSTKSSKKPFSSKMPPFQLALRSISDARDLLNGTLVDVDPIEDQITKI